MHESIKQEIQDILQESDSRRILDSLERVTLMAFFTEKGVQFQNLDNLPETIEGWTEWAVNYSKSL
jgi:hypothetical protein